MEPFATQVSTLVRMDGVTPAEFEMRELADGIIIIQYTQSGSFKIIFDPLKAQCKDANECQLTQFPIHILEIEGITSFEEGFRLVQEHLDLHQGSWHQAPKEIERDDRRI